MSVRLMSVRLAFVLVASPCSPVTVHAAAATSEAPALLGAWTVAWVVGLLSGVALMVFTAFDWRRFPALAQAWLLRQRRNYGWAMLSVASLAVLAFY